jgi:hypothetical protein
VVISSHCRQPASELGLVRNEAAGSMIGGLNKSVRLALDLSHPPA